MISILRSAMLALVLVFAACGAGEAVAKEQLLGSITVQPRLQRDVLRVGTKAGQYKSIRLEVRQSTVEIFDLEVVYGSGAPDNIRVRQTFKPGSSSRVIDLKGFTRAIKQINVIYKARGPAKIVFYGVEGKANVSPPKWERLGCKDVRFLIDRDTLVVGRKEGSFRAIRIKVRQAPIEIYDLRVVFGNGAKQDIRVRAFIPQGGVSRAIDLVGTNRGINRIEMLYRSIPTFKGTAEVCIDGLQR